MSVDYKEKTVIDYLEPGVEYCVTVSMVAFMKQKSAPAKYCAFTSPPRINHSGTTTTDITTEHTFSRLFNRENVKLAPGLKTRCFYFESKPS